MNTRSTLFLAVVALAILVYLVTTGLESPGTSEQNRNREQVLVFDPSAINRLELSNTEGNYVFSKAVSGKWMIESPVNYPADDNVIASLLSELEYAQRKATIEDKDLPNREKSLSDFGLKPIKVQVKIRENDHNFHLILGNETARTGTVYALINDGKKEEVAIVDKKLETLLAKGLNDWRSRKVFNFLTSDVTGLNLRKDEAETEMVKQGDLWKISKPLIAAADENEVASFLANLSTAQASGFVADNAADIGVYGLGTPALVLDISFGEKNETIRVGSELAAEKGFYYAQLASSPTVFKINQGLYQLLSGMMDQLRDRRIFALSATDKVQKLKIEKGDLVLDLAFKGEEMLPWQLVNLGGRAADPEKIRTFLESLKAVRVVSFQPAGDDLKKKSAMGKPALKVTLEVKDAKGQVQEQVLQFSAAKKAEVYVESSLRTGMVVIPEPSIPVLPAVAYEWYAKMIPFPFKGDPDFIKWERADGHTVQLQKEKAGSWPKELEGKPLEHDILDRQIQQLAAIRLREWVPSTDKTFGTPYLRLTYGQGDSKRVLEFGKEIENGGRMARIQGENLAFTMSNEVYLLFNVIPVKEESPKVPTP